ncbi:MAG: MarR family transcriptional regulator, partial [Lachnospiraceae bacterium]|nr:MarR family transcriptional regulator [Lachnospiraceae bacterium]
MSGLSSYGITHRQPRIMYYISMHEGCQQKDIARHCHVETATLSTVLSNMEKRGLIERRQSETDKRAYCIYPVEEARPVFEAVARQ